MMNLVWMRIVGFFIDKKKIIGWVSAAAIAVAAAAAGMQQKEFKDIVCGVEKVESK